MNEIQTKLNEVRRAIYAFVVVDSFLIVSSFALAAFWLGFALDYLPVRFGMSESPFFPRLLFLLFFGAVAGWLIGKWCVGRLRTRISDDSLKILLERKYAVFNDSLVTTSAKQSTSENTRRLLRKAEKHVARHMDKVRAMDLLQTGILYRKSILVVGLLLPLVWMAIMAPRLTMVEVERLFLLRNREVPRMVFLGDVSVRRITSDPNRESKLPNDAIALNLDRETRVGIGSALEIQAIAFSEHDGQRFHLPSRCRLRFRTKDGRQGSLPMQPFDPPGNTDRIKWVARGKPFAAFSSDTEIWLTAGDRTIGPYTILAAPLPAIQSISRSVEYPDYLENSSTVWQKNRSKYVNNETFPVGTSVRVRLESEQLRLKRAVVFSKSLNRPLTLNDSLLSEGVIEFDARTVAGTQEFQVSFQSDDGIHSNPVSLTWIGLTDRPPVVSVSPVGNLRYVTRDALLALEITAQDEFGIKDGEVLITLGNSPVDTLRFDWGEYEKKIVPIDLLELRRQGKLQIAEPNGDVHQTIRLSAFLSDFHPKHPAVKGQPYQFEIVSSRELMAIIEQKEAAIRTRMEKVYTELSRSRAGFETLLKQVDFTQSLTAREQQNIADNLQRVIFQTQKSGTDLGSIENSIQELVTQLENNRLKKTKKQEELTSAILIPLRDFIEQHLPGFRSELRSTIENFGPTAESMPAKREAIARIQLIAKQHAALLEKLDEILRKLVKFESHGELLDVVRGMIDQQKLLAKETDKEQKRRTFERLKLKPN